MRQNGLLRSYPVGGIVAAVRSGDGGGGVGALRRSVDCCEGPGIHRIPGPGQRRHLGRSLGTASEAASRLESGQGLTRVAGGSESGDMPTRQTGGPVCPRWGDRARRAGRHGWRGGIWPPPGGGMRNGPSESSMTARSGFRGGYGWRVGMALWFEVLATARTLLFSFSSLARAFQRAA